METIIGEHRSDLDIILTAQDYQDLSGQIILKITQLLKDIEDKLVNLIRTFGVKTETSKLNDETPNSMVRCTPVAKTRCTLKMRSIRCWLNLDFSVAFRKLIDP